MKHSPLRRSLLVAVAATPLAGACAAWPSTARDATSAHERLSALERATGGRLGVAALDPTGATHIGYRADERFPFCSTFKVIAAAAILKRSETESGLLERRIAYSKDELVAYSPITEQHAGNGMTVGALCAAALQYSDNTAGNLLLKLLGGPPATTAFARAMGDPAFRLDRWETALNSALPDDPRDTTTPAAMVASLRRLASGDVLAAPQRALLVDWMRGNTTGAARIRAGVPQSWAVADKTGTVDYGTTNDMGMLWPPGKPPVVLVIYFTQPEPAAPARSDVVAAAARIVAETLA